MKIELNLYRTYLAERGYNTTFNPSNRTLTIIKGDSICLKCKCDYSCGTWSVPSDITAK